MLNEMENDLKTFIYLLYENIIVFYDLNKLHLPNKKFFFNRDNISNFLTNILMT